MLFASLIGNITLHIRLTSEKTFMIWTQNMSGTCWSWGKWDVNTSLRNSQKVMVLLQWLYFFIFINACRSFTCMSFENIEISFETNILDLNQVPRRVFCVFAIISSWLLTHYKCIYRAYVWLWNAVHCSFFLKQLIVPDAKTPKINTSLVVCQGK